MEKKSNDQPNMTPARIDVSYIFNLTTALSNIVFTSYDEENGEIAKGRAFGTKGEHAAADILFENMSLLGLHPIRERLSVRPGVLNDELITQLEVLNYTVTLNGRALDCFMAPSWKGPDGQPSQLNCTFSYDDLRVKPMPVHQYLYNRTLAEETEDFVFLGQDQWNDPSAILPILDIMKPYLDPLKFYMLFHMASLIKIQLQTTWWYHLYPHCKGLLLSDFNLECHDMLYFMKNQNSLPVIFITGNDGKLIRDHLNDSVVDFTLSQRFNTSVVSYNVIGEMKGYDERKTIILCCLYDGWWSQSTADSAIGMAMVLGIAKYFIEADITPKYTVKFIGFSGEEYNMRGAEYYKATHADETILAVIDLNQLGFTQETPRLTLNFVSNNNVFLQKVWKVVEQTDYVQRTGNVTDITAIWWASGTIPGNSYAFTTEPPRCNGLSVFKDGGWILHHRDGKNHTEGDVLSYFNWTDTEVTTELIKNITVALAIGDLEVAPFPSSNEMHDTFFMWLQKKGRLV